MTETRRWLEFVRERLTRLAAGSLLMLAAGLVVASWIVGIGLARLGVYRTLPAAVLLGWGLAAAAVIGSLWHWGRVRRRLGVANLARVVERNGERRRGSVAGLAAWDPGARIGSLVRAADRSTAAWLESHGERSLDAVARQARRSVAGGAVALAGAVIVFVGLGPTAAASAPFWSPIEVLMRGRMPVTLTVDRTRVRRGASVTVSIDAPGRREASLWTRSPGEAWKAQPLQLDAVGSAAVTIGPLESDRYFRAESRGRSSTIVHVEVALPALLTDLQLIVRYPGYLERPDEPVTPGVDTVALPVGSRIRTDGRATVDVAAAAWVSSQDEVPLEVEGQRFRGTLVVRRGGRFSLVVTPAHGGELDEPAPVLVLLAVTDSVPIVVVPIPGEDTVAPLSLRQPLLVDVRDDHALVNVELVSWRVNRFGVRGEDLVEVIPLPSGGTDRAVLHWVLDLNERGFLPGDTAYFKVRATDNAPGLPPQVGESRVFALRLPAMWELRSKLREEFRGVDGRVDSLAAQQEELARSLEDLAAERERGQGNEQLPFNSVERTRRLLDQQEEALARAEELREALQELSEAAWSAGLTDPEFQRRLSELRELLDRALSEELAQRLEELRASLEQLDASDVREALRNLADAARRLQEEFERERELFERAALEGEMTSLAADAEELLREQQDWNAAAQQGVDSLLAQLEEALAQRTDSLSSDLEQLDAAVDSMGGDLSESSQGAAQASQQMRQAAQQSRQGQTPQARRSGEAASESLAPLSDALREQRDRLREEWRREVLATMDAALVETADLAQEQEAIANRLQDGETGADVRGSQGAVREGVDRIMERLQSAAGKNALVSPRLGATLGLSRLRMSQALDQLQRSTPDGRQAGAAAGDALDALNALVYALLQTRGEIAGSQSGTGLQEALEQLAQLAEQQGAMNGETGSMLSMAQTGALMQQLQALAQRQRGVGQQLDRLDAGGEVDGADELAEEAREIARELESGRVDRQLTERQERLFRRLLDAGRTLQSDDEDERQERVSQAAAQDDVRIPQMTGEIPGGEPKYRVPTWDELRALSPEQRRLILDYFRRLNERRP